MDNKKILGGVLIFILFMLLFRSLRNHISTTTTTTTVTKSPFPYSYYHRKVVSNPNYHPNANPYKGQYYN